MTWGIKLPHCRIQNHQRPTKIERDKNQTKTSAQPARVSGVAARSLTHCLPVSQPIVRRLLTDWSCQPGLVCLLALDSVQLAGLCVCGKKKRSIRRNLNFVPISTQRERRDTKPHTLKQEGTTRRRTVRKNLGCVCVSSIHPIKIYHRTNFCGIRFNTSFSQQVSLFPNRRDQVYPKCESVEYEFLGSLSVPFPG